MLDTDSHSTLRVCLGNFVNDIYRLFQVQTQLTKNQITI